MALELLMVVEEEGEEEEDVAHRPVVSIVYKSAVCRFLGHGKISRTICERFSFYHLIYEFLRLAMSSMPMFSVMALGLLSSRAEMI